MGATPLLWSYCTFLNHSFFLISGHLEVNVEFLIQIDKLVQLIESPIFTCEYDVIFLCNIETVHGLAWHLSWCLLTCLICGLQLYVLFIFDCVIYNYFDAKILFLKSGRECLMCTFKKHYVNSWNELGKRLIYLLQFTMYIGRQLTLPTYCARHISCWKYFEFINDVHSCTVICNMNKGYFKANKLKPQKEEKVFNPNSKLYFRLASSVAGHSAQLFPSQVTLWSVDASSSKWRFYNITKQTGLCAKWKSTVVWHQVMAFQ